MKEHDGIEMPVSTIQCTTKRHAQRISEHEAAREMSPGPAPGVLLVGEMDGVEGAGGKAPPEADDKRKGKVLSWKEVRQVLARSD